MKYFSLMFISITALLCFTSCASMRIEGRGPVERATSAADILLEGKTADRYIKVYAEELVEAELAITNALESAHLNEILYTDIVDNVVEWISLYDRIDRLKNRYPNGLQGKKEFIKFTPIDYTQLQKEAPIKVAEALYAQALKIDTESDGNSSERLSALDYLLRAKRYSNHLNAEINALGADICYTIAETLSLSDSPRDLEKAADLYTQSCNWIPNYKNAIQKVPDLQKRSGILLVKEGESILDLESYAAFRQAKEMFTNAENLMPGIATSQLKTVNKLLTINLVILFGGEESSYPDEDAIIRALQNQISFNTYGPAILEVSFEHIKGAFNLLFMDLRYADLLLIPADIYGDVKEIYGAVHTTREDVSKTIDRIEYTGTIIEQSQEVTVFFNNTTTLYEHSNNKIEPLRTFNEEAQKTTKTFTARMYEGDREAKPENFGTGTLYISGQYATFFSGFYQDANFFTSITQNSGTLNNIGQEICYLIANFQYRK